jgi:acetyl-CoA carboxylase carboxyltransferase component
MHASKTGIADFVDANMEQQIQRARALIRLFPSGKADHARRTKSRPPCMALPRLPPYDNHAFEIRDVVAGLVDNSEYLIYREHFGRSMLCAFAWIDGYPVGILANNCKHQSGAIDCDAAAKASRFIRLCDAYGVPILTLIDVPGFMPGVMEEQKGLLRYGAQFCSAMQTSVARISVVLRRCYGAAAFLMMQTASQEGDLVLAVENSKIAIMGFDAARHVLFKNDPRSEAELRQVYFEQYESPSLALQRGLVDQIIAYEDIRATLIGHLEWTARKAPLQWVRKRHSILP